MTVEQNLRLMWDKNRPTKEDKLAMGRALYELRDHSKARRDWIRRIGRLGIPVATAYNLIARYKKDLGVKEGKQTIHGGVYFIKSECSQKFIKIGFADDVEHRCAQLQVGCPYDLSILAVMKGEAIDESKIQRKFNHLRVRGEWFRPAQELIDFMQTIDFMTGVVQ